MQIWESVEYSMKNLASHRVESFSTGIDLFCAILTHNPWLRAWGREYVWYEDDAKTRPLALAEQIRYDPERDTALFEQPFVKFHGMNMPSRVRGFFKRVTCTEAEIANEGVYDPMEYVLECEPCSKQVMNLIRSFARGISLLDTNRYPKIVNVTPMKEWEDLKQQIRVAIGSQFTSMIVLSGKPGTGRRKFLESFGESPIKNGGVSVYVMDLDAISMRVSSNYCAQVRAKAEDYTGRKGITIGVVTNADGLFIGKPEPGFEDLMQFCLKFNGIKLIFSVNSKTMNSPRMREYLNAGAIEIKYPEVDAEGIKAVLRNAADELKNAYQLRVPESVIEESLQESQKLVKSGVVKYGQPQAALKLMDFAISISLQNWTEKVSGDAFDAELYNQSLRLIAEGETAQDIIVGMKGKRMISFRSNDLLDFKKAEFDSDCVQRAMRMIYATESKKEKIKSTQLRIELGQEILGQDEAIDMLCKTIRRLEWGVKQSATRGNFMFVGPTATGKTELSKQLARKYFDESKLIQFDMSEFSEPHTVARLIGSPPGYVGSEETSLLLSRVSEAKEGVLLFDEIEKADRKVHNILLQLMEEGKVTDSTGHEVDCSKFFVVMTSNTGIHELSLQKHVGFTSQKGIQSGDVLEEIKKGFTPEFVNRLDGIIPFKRLDENVFEDLVRMYLSKALEPFKVQGIKVEFTTEVVGYLKDKAYSQEYGVRYLKRTIETEVVDVILDYLEEQTDPKGNYKVDYEGKVTVHKEDKPKRVPVDSLTGAKLSLDEDWPSDWVVDDGSKKELYSLG